MDGLLKNHEVFDEVHGLLKYVKTSKQPATWRGTVITPVETNVIRIQHGSQTIEHSKTALLTAAMLSRFHAIEL
ncbi:hypothetical protein ACFFK0_08495 [Paenibacillus chartarius]|uniref:Uncharacterized protein n=1 Tax=Paenibacillus chartarius TaxID=747481 RepID=A0ABV6DIN9_9BACL